MCPLIRYWAYANHFKSIFSGDKDSPPIFYVPGNRDVGLGPSRSFSSRARDRYREAFGEINYTLDLGNHTFVMLDAPGLIEEDYRRYAAEVRFGEWAETQTGTIQFVHELGEGACLLLVSLQRAALLTSASYLFFWMQSRLTTRGF